MVMSLDAGVIKAVVHGDVLGCRCIDAQFATLSIHYYLCSFHHFLVQCLFCHNFLQMCLLVSESLRFVFVKHISTSVYCRIVLLTYPKKICHRSRLHSVWHKGSPQFNNI